MYSTSYMRCNGITIQPDNVRIERYLREVALQNLCTYGAATKGGGIYFAGDDMAGSNGVGIVASLFTGNNAQSGGAMYAGPGARGLVAYTTFDSNTAKSYGGALLADDDSQIQISNSAFTNNGRYSCYDPPMVCPFKVPHEFCTACM